MGYLHSQILGHVQHSPSQCRRRRLHASKEEIAAHIHHLVLAETHTRKKCHSLQGASIEHHSVYIVTAIITFIILQNYASTDVSCGFLAIRCMYACTKQAGSSLSLNVVVHR